MLGVGAYVCRRRDPEAKGLVERANRFLETSFLPGRAFSEVEDFNAQLGDWLHRANARVHRGIGCRPVDRLAEDLAAMLPLPPLLPDVTARWSIRLGRDHYVRYDTCDYSVHPNAIGRRVDVAVDLATISVTCAGAEVACHRRSLVAHRVITDAVHGRAARQMRQAQQQPAATETQVAERDLTDYDRALGVAG